jgi:nucleotide-binding universal stress UspA family protein
MIMYRTILVPLDGSEQAESVLPHVEALAKQQNVESVDIVLMRTYECPCIIADYPFPERERYVEQITGYLQEVAVQYLAAIEERLKEVGLKARVEIREGNAAKEIVDYARKSSFDLIVMSTRRNGHNGLIGYAYGSVADKVLHEVSTPIFLVKSS